VSSWSILCSNH